MDDIESQGAARQPPAPSYPPRLHGRAALLLFVLAALAFAGLAADLLLHGPITALDPGISGWFREHRQPFLTTLMRAVTTLHSTGSILGIAAVAAIVLVWRREAAWVVPLVLSIPGGMLLNIFVKNQFQRPRPAFDHPLVHLVTYSFPSGHTATATVSWSFALAWLFAHRTDPRERVLGCVVAAAMVLLTALSRVYLGAHYPSDVMAAAAEGLTWLAFCFLVVGRRPWRGIVAPQPR